MGRVYDALKRAAEANGANGKRSANGDAGVPPAEENGAGEEHAERATAVAPLHPSEPLGLGHATATHFAAPETARESAPNERTGQSVGSALPDGRASRVAGATLGAASSARAYEFQSLEISPACVEPHIVAVTQPNSAHAERFRSLRTRVLHAGERRKMQAFVVTSAGVMEGKTMTAVNLAWLLAQTDGVSALLIDGDLRKPTAADYLGLDVEVGLSEVLAGEAALKESIIRLEPSGLHLLSGGRPRQDVAEMLSGPRFGRLLREVRGMFDYIVIDTPPLGIFTDATMLISRADAALLVARAGRTRFSALERLLEPIARERVLGVVLNGADQPISEKYGNYYYYNRRRYEREGDPGEVEKEKA